MGLTGYYRKFIHHNGIIAQALTDMLKNDSFRWTPAVEQAFEELKMAMALSTYEEEMLGLVKAVQKWRPYLFVQKWLLSKNGW